jgi:iron complex transport system ATP-binding protein
VLLGLAVPASGQVLIGGAAIASMARRRIARCLAYVPQAHTTPFPYTVRQVVTMGRLPHRGLLSNPSPADCDAVSHVLAQLGISRLADRIYTEISGGERQLTLIARALAQGAHILLLDEPMANLDFGYQAVLCRHLRQLADAGHAIVMSGHDPQLASQTATRIALLMDGRIEHDGLPQDVLTAATMRKLYGIDVDIAAVPGARMAFLPATR